MSQHNYIVPGATGAPTPAIMRPNEVKGFFGQSAAQKPTRVFNILQSHGPRDFVWEIDGYMVRDKETGKELWSLVLICPSCDRVLRIDSKKKSMEISEKGLQVEPFACTWPAQDGAGGACSFQAAIDLPRASDRVIPTEDGIQRKIDGTFKAC